MTLLQDEQEYAVIALVLQLHFVSDRHPRLLLRAQVADPSARLRYVDYAKFAGLPHARGEAKRTYREEEGDWILKNRNDPRQLDPAHPALAGHDVLSEDDYADVFDRQNGIPAAWQRFHERYPDRGGLVGVSRVGFDTERLRALVQASRTSGGLSGYGLEFHLSFTGEGWAITRGKMAWIS
ncbi:hypothetical protein ACFFLM_15695 [Deinococcus oregonensis]|uniref:Uncharacterized protein n=1 Tax=Deinococcus oregonensis TaxID=1805970 RepID=A0ABV6B389_9DEIO